MPDRRRVRRRRSSHNFRQVEEEPAPLIPRRQANGTLSWAEAAAQYVPVPRAPTPPVAELRLSRSPTIFRPNASDAESEGSPTPVASGPSGLYIPSASISYVFGGPRSLAELLSLSSLSGNELELVALSEGMLVVPGVNYPGLESSRNTSEACRGRLQSISRRHGWNDDAVEHPPLLNFWKRVNEAHIGLFSALDELKQTPPHSPHYPEARSRVIRQRANIGDDLSFIKVHFYERLKRFFHWANTDGV